MTTIHCRSYYFVPVTGEENTIDVVFYTEDYIPHQSAALYPPYHLTRSGRESPEFLIRALQLALDREFVNYTTLAPRVTSHDYQVINSGNLNVSSFSDDTGMNIVSTILVVGQLNCPEEV